MLSSSSLSSLSPLANRTFFFIIILIILSTFSSTVDAFYGDGNGVNGGRIPPTMFVADTQLARTEADHATCISTVTERLWMIGGSTTLAPMYIDLKDALNFSLGVDRMSVNPSNSFFSTAADASGDLLPPFHGPGMYGIRMAAQSFAVTSKSGGYYLNYLLMIPQNLVNNVNLETYLLIFDCDSGVYLDPLTYNSVPIANNEPQGYGGYKKQTKQTHTQQQQQQQQHLKNHMFVVLMFAFVSVSVSVWRYIFLHKNTNTQTQQQSTKQ